MSEFELSLTVLGMTVAAWSIGAALTFSLRAERDDRIAFSHLISSFADQIRMLNQREGVYFTVASEKRTEPTQQK
ncbi:hypothetical protein [Hyphococcus luteus]|nr:hypothetical protein [Marinicaulis flavus]